MRILLVDDEPGLVEAWREILAPTGTFEIRTAATGGDALREARAWPEGPEILVTDVVMEPMDGFALRDRLVTEFPAMRTVFVTGYDLSAQHDRVGDAAVLPKPVDAAKLAAALGAPSAAPQTYEFGGFHVQEHLRHQDNIDEYLAWQGSMSRHAVLHVMDEESARDPAAVAAFLADARAKAAVSHPYLFAVHEAGEVGGRCFYSSDYVPGYTLEAYRLAGHKLDDRTLLAALRTAADVSAHFGKHGLTRRSIGPADLVLDASLRPRMVNTAVAAAPAPDETAEVKNFAETVAALAQQGSVASAVAQTLAAGQADWAGVAAMVAAAKPAAAPKDASKLTARTEKSKQMLEQSKKQQKKRLIISAGMSLLLLIVAVFALFRIFSGGKQTVFNELVEIPAGEFVYQDGEKVNLPAFWIDQYEVTIAEYKMFLDFLEANPGEAEKFAHPDMPKGKSHVPLDWADNNALEPPMPGYYTRAVKWKQYKDAPLTVDSPVFNVDWFDAYAYAKWKGRRLPTEQEWEKAARGTDARKYPWGNDEDAKRVNSGADYVAGPGKGGEVDGFKAWAPVNEPEGDKSPRGVRGMAGNVSEWTASWAPAEGGMGGDVPVIRGGNWENPGYKLTSRKAILDPLQISMYLGFRTVSDTKPQP
jgi:formylglycine-generating enzyme required for sulfatase activity/CheY-like chemotaxis protein